MQRNQISLLAQVLKIALFSRYLKSFFLSFIFLCSSVSSFSQASRSITVGILIDISDEEAEVFIQDLKDNIRGVLGDEQKVVFKPVLKNDLNLSNALKNYQALSDENADVILAFGIVNSIMLYQAESISKPTIALGAVNRDLIPQIQSSKDNNVVFQTLPSSYSDDLKAFESLYEFREIGILADEGLLSMLPLEVFFSNYFSSKERSFTLVPLKRDGLENVSLDGLDAVYLIENFLADQQLTSLAQQINAKKIPSLSANGIGDVEKGFLLTYQPDLDAGNFIRRIALSLEAIVNGADPSHQDLSVDDSKSLSINFNTVDQIDFPLRYSMLGSVNFVSDESFKNPELESYSLIGIMKEVLDKNIALDVQKKEVSLSQQSVKSSKSDYYPDLSIGATGTYIDPELASISNGSNPELLTAGNVSLQQVIYSQGVTTNIGVQKNLLRAQMESLNAAQLDALLNASVAYFNALILKTSVRIQNRNLQLTKKNLRIAEQNFEVGAAGKSNVLRFRSQMAQNVQSLVDATNSLDQAYIVINQLMNRPIGSKVEIQDAELSSGLFEDYNYVVLSELLDDPRTRDQLVHFFVEEAFYNSPDLKGLDYNIDAIQLDYNLNDWGRFIPTLSLQGNYNYTFSKSGEGSVIPEGFPVVPDGTYNVGLNLSFPIFQQNKRNINRQTAFIQKDQLLTQRANIKQSIETNVNDVTLELIKQIANIEISKANERFAAENLDLSQEEYKTGSIPVIQLLDAQNNYLEAQLIRANAQYNYLIVAMQLERIMGHFFLVSSEEENTEFVRRAREFILTKKQ